MPMSIRIAPNPRHKVTVITDPLIYFLRDEVRRQINKPSKPRSAGFQLEYSGVCAYADINSAYREKCEGVGRVSSKCLCCHFSSRRAR